MPERRDLPKPVSLTEMFLHDIAVSLRQIVRIQKATLATKIGKVAYSETTSEGESATTEARPLPADFPGKAELEAAGISSLDDVPRTAKRLKAIHGIGPATATGILKRL